MDEHVIVFHSALGMRPAVGRFAARLRGGGHTVHTPDVYDGQVFDDVAAGAAARDAIGVLELIKRAQAAVEDLPPGLVYVGFSMGTGAAELLAGTRPGARAAILMHGALAPADIGLRAWPHVPIQVHYAKDDPDVNVDQILALEASARAASVPVEVHVYDRVGHLFEDPGLPGHDPELAELMTERVLSFLDGLPSAHSAGRPPGRT